ncbi:MAG TPA: APC family permease [Phycisphaerae bacterium]|nr:APC family permease [Phycisphaerae bacterium]
MATETEMEPFHLLTRSKLRSNCLNFWEILAQSVALISPTMTAALIVPLMFGTAGEWGWLCYAFGTVMLFFVAMNLNQFAKRSTSAGSMYDYSVRGLGKIGGGIGGWCLIWAYLFIGIAGVSGFTHFAKILLGLVGVPDVPILSIGLFAVCVFIAWFMSYKDVQLSALMMLIMEAVSVSLVLILMAIVCAHTGVVDTAQFNFSGISLSIVGLGVVVAVFSGVGFEAATAFGEEAKNPLKTIPRAVYASLIATGLFFVLITYLETLALKGHNPTLDNLVAPLNTLSDMFHLPWMGVLISAGAMISFFALALSCMNSGARIIFSMGRSGIFHMAAATSHHKNLTPHVALSVMALLQFIIPAFGILASAVNLSTTGSGTFHMEVIDAFNWAGTFGAFGFCGGYFVISIAAPVYLKRIGELKPMNIVISVLAVLLLLVPAIGTVYPEPSPPFNYFSYIFGAYVLVGIIWIAFFRRAKFPHLKAQIEPALIRQEIPSASVGMDAVSA